MIISHVSLFPVVIFALPSIFSLSHNLFTLWHVFTSFSPSLALSLPSALSLLFPLLHFLFSSHFCTFSSLATSALVYSLPLPLPFALLQTQLPFCNRDRHETVRVALGRSGLDAAAQAALTDMALALVWSDRHEHSRMNPVTLITIITLL